MGLAGSPTEATAEMGGAMRPHAPAFIVHRHPTRTPEGALPCDSKRGEGDTRGLGAMAAPPPPVGGNLQAWRLGEDAANCFASRVSSNST
eukprot:16714-Chlamydomonas_euryale.AAC.6